MLHNGSILILARLGNTLASTRIDRLLQSQTDTLPWCRHCNLDSHVPDSSFLGVNCLTVCIFARGTSLYITPRASHDRTFCVAKTALMPRVNDVPELSVHFHMRVVEVVAEWRVVFLIIVIIIVAVERRLGRIFREAPIGIRAIVIHFFVSLVFTKCLWQWRSLRCMLFSIELRAFIVGRKLPLVRLSLRFCLRLCLCRWRC